MTRIEKTAVFDNSDHVHDQTASTVSEKNCY